MRKKILLIAVTIFVGMFASAQVNEENVQMSVSASQKLFLETIKKKQNPDQKKVFVKDKNVKLKQFLIENGKQIIVGKKDTIKSNDDLRKVCGILKKESQGYTRKEFTFTYDEPEFVSIKPVMDDKNKNKEVDHYDVVYKLPKCNTKVSCAYNDIISNSDATYENIQLTWRANVKLSNGELTLKKIELTKVNITVNATAKAAGSDDAVKIANEKASQIANAKIREWYNTNVPSYFESKIDGDAVTSSELLNKLGSKVEAEGIKVSVNLGESAQDLKKTVTITENLPSVKLYVDSKKYMKQGESYTTDTIAYHTFSKPSFKLTFNEDYSNVEIENVNFGESELKEPKSDDMVEVAKNKATSELDVFESDFQNKLQAYLKEPNADNTKAFKSLFKDGTKVEVSIVSNSGNTKRTYSIDQYISRVKGAEISLDMDKYQFSTENATDFNSAYINYTKNYKRERENYCDSTKKKMTLQKDGDSYKITKIEVVEDAVRCSE